MIKKSLPFGFDKPEDSPGFSLWQATMAWQKMIKKTLEPYDVSHSQFVIMALLLWLDEHESDVTQVRLINLSKLDKMTVSKSLKKLVEQGLVNRVEHEVDTRAKVASLTAQGKKLICRLVPMVEAVDAEFFGTISSSKQKVLISILSELASSDIK